MHSFQSADMKRLILILRLEYNTLHNFCSDMQSGGVIVVETAGMYDVHRFFLDSDYNTEFQTNISGGTL